MASRSLLLLLGMWAITSHGGAVPSTGEPRLRLTGGGCRCSGMLEVNWDGKWSRVCQDVVIGASADGMCRSLGCGPPITGPLRLAPSTGKEPPLGPLRCPVLVDAPMGCVWEPANCTEHAVLTCSEPAKTTPAPPPATTPEPTGPPRLRLVDGDTGCSGFLELHKAGMWGSVATDRSIPVALAARVCGALGCGSALEGSVPPRPRWGSPLPVRWEVMEPCGSLRLLECFNGSSGRRGAEPAFIRCSDSQPKALRRLASGPTPCEGDIEVFHRDQWRVLCDSRTLRAQWGRELCQELRCGNLSSSTETRDPPPSTGVTCGVPNLHLCPLRDTPSCSRIRVVCQDSKPHPRGTAPGTIVSICLALLLFGILLVLCGPPAYRRLMKRRSRKKQRQWIGPTGLNQTVSFHRNSTITQRPRAEGQRVQGGDNDYAQPPKKSPHTPEYPALEGALRPPNPSENASDSDYDLHSACRV
ncbi:T-cell surface glycoprotein CD5 [Pezoporus flaviventris]|uniref:T-cell surface glycoprotein CD5 n=1 Tax=Pezoporus flaviventris TaxID=889875 RepID=UPI002AB21198|nr:T-cell surface glycoprotein CD5 [Pezoporus flaviventris]